MNDGNGGNGRGGGTDGHDFDGADSDDETVVIVSDEYTRRALGRLADGLRDAAALCERFREGGEAASPQEKVVVLGELRQRLREIRLHAEGAERGAGRLERDELATINGQKHTKERR